MRYRHYTSKSPIIGSGLWRKPGTRSLFSAARRLPSCVLPLPRGLRPDGRHRASVCSLQPSFSPHRLFSLRSRGRVVPSENPARCDVPARRTTPPDVSTAQAASGPCPQYILPSASAYHFGDCYRRTPVEHVGDDTICRRLFDECGNRPRRFHFHLVGNLSHTVVERPAENAQKCE